MHEIMKNNEDTNVNQHENAKKIAQKLNFKYGIRCMCTNEPHTKITNTKNNSYNTIRD